MFCAMNFITVIYFGLCKPYYDVEFDTQFRYSLVWKIVDTILFVYMIPMYGAVGYPIDLFFLFIDIIIHMFIFNRCSPTICTECSDFIFVLSAFLLFKFSLMIIMFVTSSFSLMHDIDVRLTYNCCSTQRIHCIENQSVCSICLDPLHSDWFIYELGCKHQFHRNCLHKWFTQQQLVTQAQQQCSCPLCRHRV